MSRYSYRRNGEHLTLDEVWQFLLESNPPEIHDVLNETLRDLRPEIEALFLAHRDGMEAALIRQGRWRPSGAVVAAPAPAAPAESQARRFWLELAELARRVLTAEFGAEYAQALAREFETEAASA